MRVAVSRPFYIARFLIEIGDLAIFFALLQVHMQGDIHYSSARKGALYKEVHIYGIFQ